MPKDKSILKDGDIIVYAREDNGGKTSWIHPVTNERVGFEFVGTLAHIAGAKVREAEKIICGDQDGIPTFHAQALVDDGVCALYTPPASLLTDAPPDTVKLAKGTKADTSGDPPTTT
jgi:hypothetical protein